MGASKSIPEGQKDPVTDFFEDPMRALGLVGAAHVSIC